MLHRYLKTFIVLLLFGGFSGEMISYSWENFIKSAKTHNVVIAELEEVKIRMHLQSSIIENEYLAITEQRERLQRRIQFFWEKQRRSQQLFYQFENTNQNNAFLKVINSAIDDYLELEQNSLNSLQETLQKRYSNWLGKKEQFPKLHR